MKSRRQKKKIRQAIKIKIKNRVMTAGKNEAQMKTIREKDKTGNKT